MLSKEEKTGLVVAPLAGVAVFAVYLIILFTVIPLGRAAFLKLLLLSVPFAYAGTLIVGIPIILALKKSDDLSLIRLVVAGGFAGAFIHPFSVGLIARDGMEFNIISVYLGAIEGLAVAITYGIVSKVKVRDAAT